MLFSVLQGSQTLNLQFSAVYLTLKGKVLEGGLSITLLLFIRQNSKC